MHFSTKNNVHNNDLKACNKFKLYSNVKTRKTYPGKYQY